MPWDNNNNGPWNGGNNPWGKKDANNSNNNSWNPKNKGDDLDKMLNQFKEKIQKFFSKGPKSFIVGFLVLFFLWLMSGFYTISPEEQGVVLRFGKYVSISSPGLNYHVPSPIEKVIKVPVMYASPERWVSIQKRGFMRDKRQQLVIFSSLIFQYEQYFLFR